MAGALVVVPGRRPEVKFLRAVVFVVLILLVGYNYWQINQLRSELAAIKTKVHSGKAADEEHQDLLTSLGLVKEHTARAKELLSKGQPERARAELDKSLRKLEKASDLSQDIAVDAARSLGAAWVVVKREAESAWKGFSSQNGKRRPGGNEPASGE